MSPTAYSEDELVEQPTLRELAVLGYETLNGYEEPDELGRDDQSEVVLRHRLRPKLLELNPELPEEAIDSAIETFTQDRSAMDPVRANREIHGLLRDGIKVSVPGDHGEQEADRVRLIDWNDTSANEFLAVNQFWVIGPLHKRRSDIVCFVNGIPLVLLELKASHKTAEQGYRENICDYRDTIPGLFECNGLVIVSTGSET